MAFCSRCGTEIGADVLYCPNCGSLRSNPQASAPSWQPSPVGVWPGMAIGLPASGPNSVADIGERLLARIIDGVVMVGGFLIVLVVLAMFLAVTRNAFYPLGGMSGIFTLMALAIPFLGVVLYEVVLTATRGQTLGKMALKIKVVSSSTGRHPDWGASLLRWVIPLGMSIIPFLPLLDYLWALWDENRQCLHDKAATTLVIRTG